MSKHVNIFRVNLADDSNEIAIISALRIYQSMWRKIHGLQYTSKKIQPNAFHKSQKHFKFALNMSNNH